MRRAHHGLGGDRDDLLGGRFRGRQRRARQPAIFAQRHEADVELRGQVAAAEEKTQAAAEEEETQAAEEEEKWKVGMSGG